MAANKGLLRYFDGAMDWSPVRKSRLLITILTATLLHYWLFQSYQLRYPSPYINYSLMQSLQWVMPVQIVINLLMIQASKRYDNSTKAQKYFPYLSTFYYSISLVALGYIIGLSNLTTGLVMVGAPLFGFLLFRRHVIYTAFALSTTLILILSLLSAYDFIPYAPLFKTEFFYAVDARPFYLLCMVYFSLPHFISIFGFCDVFFILWRQRERNIRHISITDGLTNLLNRRAIGNNLKGILQASAMNKKPVSVILLDVDFFKKINDLHGHMIGDKALQVVAATLESTLRRVDKLGRYGGEEFLIILNETSLQQAIIIADRCRMAIANAYIHDEFDQRLKVTASFGVSCSDNCDYIADRMIRQADRYLYEAKQQERNQVVSILNTITI